MTKLSSFIFFVIFVCSPIFSLAQLSPRQERNLTAFTKLYGYVRFFYPGDEAQQINWDMMAIYGSSQVLNQPTDKALIDELKKLFFPVAPAIKISSGNQPPVFDKAGITPPHTKIFKVIARQRMAYDVSGGYASMRVNRRDLQLANEEKGHMIYYSTVDLDKYPGQSFLMTVKLNNMDTAVVAHELRDSLRPHYLPRLSSRPAKLVNGAYQIEDTIGVQSKTLAIGFNTNYRGKPVDVETHLYISNHNQKVEVPLQMQAGDWSFYQPGTQYYAFTFNDLNNTDKPFFDTQATLGETIQTKLVEGISCMVPLALYGDLYNTYPKTAGSATLYELERHIAQTKANITSLDTRLGDVVIAWNVFQHFFPYWSNASKTPQQLLHEALIKASLDKNFIDFFYTTKLMCAALNDGHMFCNWYAANEGSVPLVLAQAEGKLVVKFVLDKSLDSSISAGDVIEAIDGRRAIDTLRHEMRYMPGSPQCKLRDALINLLNGPQIKPLRLTIHHQGKTTIVNINRNGSPVAFRPGNFSLQRVNNGLLKDGIYYYDLSADSAFNEIKQQLKMLQAKAIILDLRCYPPSVPLFLISQLLKHDDDTHWLYEPQYIYPDHQRIIYHHIDWKVKKATPHINTPIYCLVDASTQSMGESIAGYFKDFKLATVIGEPTAGANGGIAEFRIPEMSNMTYSGQLVTNHNGSREHVIGVMPDIAVKLTIQGITEGRDEILERAVAEAERLKLNE